MMLADLLFMVLVGYLLYRFVYGFIVPLMRASKQVREQFRNMQQPSNDFGAGGAYRGQQQSPGSQQQSNGSQQQSHGSQQQSSGGQQGPKRRPPAEDYIDFEEIK